jgi:hypothetical protein
VTTKQAGGRITGLLALTLEAQEALAIGDPVHVVGDYEVEKADGTKPCVGFVSVKNVARGAGGVISALSPGQVTVEAPGFMVQTAVAAVPFDAGVLIGLNASGLVPFSGSVSVTNEVQTATQGGSGLTSFTLTFDGQTTASIAAAATAADVVTALEALSNIAAGDVSAVRTGSSGSYVYTITFGGNFAGENVPQMTATPTGGTGTVTIATATGGANSGAGPVGIALTASLAAGDSFDLLVR